MVRYLNAIWILDLILSGIQTTIWIPDQYSNGGLNTKLQFEYLTSEYRTSKSSLFRCFWFSDVRYSDPHCNCVVSSTGIPLKNSYWVGLSILLLAITKWTHNFSIFSKHNDLPIMHSVIVTLPRKHVEIIVTPLQITSLTVAALGECLVQEYTKCGVVNIF